MYRVVKRVVVMLPDAQANLKKLAGIAETSSERIIKLGEVFIPFDTHTHTHTQLNFFFE